MSEKISLDSSVKETEIYCISVSFLSLNHKSIFNSTGQWSEPKISVCIFALHNFSLSDAEARK